jgi:hypothetical protein
MTLEWHAMDSDEAGPVEAWIVVGGEELPLLSATHSTVICRGSLARRVRLPVPIRAVISHAEKSFVFPLVATRLLPQSEPDRVGFAVEAQTPLVWAVAAGDLTAGMEPTLETVTSAARSDLPGDEGRRRRFDFRAMLKARVPILGFAALAIVLAIVVAREAYARIYVAGANASVISIDLVPVQSPGNGRIVFLTEKPRLAAGEPLFGLTQRSGSDMSLESPCACDVFARLALPGAVIRRGEPVLYLTRPEATPFVVANVDRDLLFRFGNRARVRLSYGDGVVVERALGRVDLIDTTAPTPAEEIATDATIGADTPVAKVTVNLRLDPGRDLDRAMIGSPVDVRFDFFDFDSSTIGRLITATGLWQPSGGRNASS